jgi:hypothetical protein
MQALNKQNDKQRAILLHQLFPGEIRGFLQFAVVLAGQIAQTDYETDEEWAHPNLSAGDWVNLAAETARVIREDDGRLIADCRYFGERLFAGNLGKFNADSMIKYAMYSIDPAFKAITRAVFDYLPGEPAFTAQVNGLCLEQDDDFLFDAVTEALRQQGIEGLNEDARYYLNRGPLASLATLAVIWTDKLDYRGHCIDTLGRFILPFHK